jgi:uncharacterized protein (DUF427 family)
MGLSWQQGPLAPGAIGRFLVPGPLPARLPFAEPLRRRMRVRLAGAWVADSEDVVLLHEPGRYPVAYFPLGDVAGDVLLPAERTTEHRDFGPTAWYTVQSGTTAKERAAYQHVDPPDHAAELRDRVAFAWRAMDAFFEEDERIVGHAADNYHRIDIRQSSRHLRVQHAGEVIADTTKPLVLFESGFAPRWYVPRSDVHRSALTPAEGQTFCRTRDCAATTTSPAHRGPCGPMRTPGPRFAASPGTCRSNRTSSRSAWTASSCARSRVRPSSRTASTAT